MTESNTLDDISAIGFATENDDIFKEINDEFEQIRSCIGMYISKLNTDGALHLIKELTNNCLDECVNPNSSGNKIRIEFDEKNRMIIICDNGRGIPFDRMVDCCTKKHTSTKIDRTAPWVKGLAGRNGVGLVVCAATSDFMCISSYRDGWNKKISFNDGKLEELPLTPATNGFTGTEFRIIPSEKYLGKIDLTSDLVEDYIRCLSYTLPSHVEITYIAWLKKEKEPYERVFKRAGLNNCVKYLSQNLEFDPILIETGMIREDAQNPNNTINFDLQMAFSYDKHVDIMVIDSYCNYIHTTEGGNHETVVQQAICSYFSREARKLDPNAKYEVTFDDCRKGLIVAVNCSHINPAFEGQHKTRVSNSDVMEYGKSLIVEGLEAHFDKDNGVLRKIISYLRMVAKIRMEANKIKGVKEKKLTNFIDDMKLTSYHPLTDRNYNGYTELFISEGLSAGNQLNAVRNSKHQAVLCMRGPINNVIGMTYTTMMTKEMCRALVNVFGCGAGPTFDISKFRWSRVNIMTDADIDGSFLASLLISFIWKFMPELIRSGKIHIIRAPLYLLNESIAKRMLKDKSAKPWAYSITELHQIFNRIASDNLKIFIPLGKMTETFDSAPVKELTKKEALDWMSMNEEYLIELEALNTRTFCEPFVLEVVCFAYQKYEKDSERLHYIYTLLPEVTYDEENTTFYGAYEGKPVNLIADAIFFHKIASRFLTQLKKNSNLIIGACNRNNKEDLIEYMSIGEFLNMVRSKYVIKIDQRYKGLGEAEAYILFVSTMHPKLRKSIRLTVNDAERMTKRMEQLHGDAKEFSQWRRDLLKSTPISYNDIDN